MKGYYLKRTSYLVTYGVCTLKSSVSSPSYTLYVNNVNYVNAKSAQAITGTSLTDSFNTLQDGMAKAYELGAPYTSATITIILIEGGDHALVRKSPTFNALPYTQTASDDSQTTKIVITTSYGG